MTFNLKSPCKQCPFRSNVTPYLSIHRLRGILEDRHVFVCHKTVDYSSSFEGVKTSKTQACAGFLICMQHDDKQNDLMQIAHRLGIYRPQNMNMEAPVFKGAKAALAAHRRKLK